MYASANRWTAAMRSSGASRGHSPSSKVGAGRGDGPVDVGGRRLGHPADDLFGVRARSLRSRRRPPGRPIRHRCTASRARSRTTPPEDLRCGPFYSIGSIRSTRRSPARSRERHRNLFQIWRAPSDEQRHGVDISSRLFSRNRAFDDISRWDRPPRRRDHDLARAGGRVLPHVREHRERGHRSERRHGHRRQLLRARRSRRHQHRQHDDAPEPRLVADRRRSPDSRRASSSLPASIDNAGAAAGQLALTTAYDERRAAAAHRDHRPRDLTGLTLQGGVYAGLRPRLR